MVWPSDQPEKTVQKRKNKLERLSADKVFQTNLIFVCKAGAYPYWINFQVLLDGLLSLAKTIRIGCKKRTRAKHSSLIVFLVTDEVAI